MSVMLVYLTAKDRAEAETVGRALVEARLAACVNIVDGMTSIYWWEGAVQTETETLLLAKTRTDLVDELVAKVKAVHGYAVPAVSAVPVLKGSKEYLRWVEAETRQDEDPAGAPDQA